MANLDQIIEHVAGDCKVEINENPSITSTTAVSAGDSLRGCFVYFLDELGGVIKKFLFPHILCERGCAA